ncbi:right-handed parallel beta-helix repeat-containing protein [bacterium]|nr:right-handed parallel beta-helix repeat-containing protein [bacterium]
MTRPVILFLLLLIMFLTPLSVTALVRSGTIDADETWTLSDSPVQVEGLLEIKKNIILVIESGVEVQFSLDAGIIANGLLIALGNAEDTVRFTSASEKKPGAWGGIYLRGRWSGATKLDQKENALAAKKAALAESVFEDGEGNTYQPVGDYYQRQDGKYFYEDAEGALKEYKGKVVIEEEVLEATLLDTITISYMDYCIIEYAGGPVESGSALEISNIDPIINHCLINKCLGNNGTVRCCNQAKPLIKNSVITNNRANRGGAVNISLNAMPLLKNNTFSFNHSDDNGGAIYISLAGAEIISNSFLGNECGAHGGAIFCSISPGLVINNNTFMGNRAESASNTILLSSRVTVEIKDNVFDSFGSTGVEIYLQNVTEDIDAVSNFWGNPLEFSFRDIIRDRCIDASQPYVYYDPFLWAPPDEHRTNPARVDSIILCRDDNFSEKIPRGVAEGAPLRIRLAGVDSNPKFRDVVRARIISEYDPEGIVIPLRETAENSGIWIGRGRVTEITDQEEYGISDYEGGHVDIFAPAFPDIVATYKTMSPKPLAENLTVINIGEGDILHLTDHIPVFNWGYFDVLETPQVSFRLKVFPSVNGQISNSPIWDTGEILTENKEITYAGPKLEDAETYFTHINVWNNRFWSDTVELLFRMNSVPTVPKPNLPYTDELVPSLNPELSAEISYDNEGDSLTYNFEVYTLEDETLVSNISGVSPYHLIDTGMPVQIDTSTAGDSTATVNYSVKCDSIVKWLLPADLTENAGYTFRIKAFDPLEEGKWSEKRRFWINSLEEPADPFDLKYPIGRADVYLLHPTLEWATAVDPDPLSSVLYTVEIDKSQAFSSARIYEKLKETSYMLPDSLDNVTEYFWRITATDNTNRTTISTSVGNFYVDTTPSIPVSSAPLDGEERMPPDMLTWKASSDPNPNDMIFYEVEIYETQELTKVAADIAGWQDISLPVEKLNRWEGLVDNHVYSWRVRSRDNHTASSEFGQIGSFFYNHYNDNPAPVLSASAPKDTVMGTTDIHFAWTETSDPDLSDPASTLVYDVECVLDNFESGKVRAFASLPGVTELTAPLDDNLLWYYRIRTRDNENAVSEWNKVDSVLVNFAEDAPTAFNLQHPRQDSLVVELDSLMFIWQSSSDPDWESSIIYRFELTPAGGQTFRIETPETKYHFKEGLTNELSYSWSVTAVDNIGLETVVNSGFSFRTNTTPTMPIAAEMPIELMPNDPFRYNCATDPNPVDVLTYTVEVSPSESFDPALIHVEKIKHHEGIIDVTLKSLTGQEKLDDDHDYWFRVRATDNHGYNGAYSKSVQIRFNRENDAPGDPMPAFAPIDSAVIRSQNPTCEWQHASDIDLTDPPEKLVYDLRFDDDGELEKNVKFNYSTNPGLTTFQVPDNLKDNTLWFWQVRTRDDDGAVSAWSEMQPFLVNVVEDPATVPELTTPSSGQLLNYLGPIEFKWIASQDIDFMSSITYRIEYGTSSDLSGAVVINDLVEPTYTAAYPLENTKYYWRVTAIDNTELETASLIEIFTLDTRPSVPLLVAPKPAAPIPLAEHLADGVFTWSKSTDPNPRDKITYTIQVAKKLLPQELSVLTVETIEETSIPVSTWANDLKDDEVYVWHVRSIDEHSIASAWSDTLSFFYNPVNDNPGAVSGALQPANDKEVPAVELSWGAASDVDISDPPERIMYRVEMTSDQAFKENIKTFDTKQGVTTLAPQGLTDETRWYWRIRAIDNEGAESPVSSVANFIYNIVNDAPAKVTEILSPVNKLETAKVEVKWNGVTDKDLTDTPEKLVYRVEFAQDAVFSGKVETVTTNPGVTSLISPNIADNTTWFWRVCAVDDEGLAGTYSNLRCFTYNVKNDPPEIPVLAEPMEGTVVTAVSLKWKAVNDPDPFDVTESLKYNIELCKDNGFASGVIKQSVLAGVTTLKPEGVEDNNVWYWRVQAVDDEGLTGGFSKTGSFTYNVKNDAPEAFKLVSPTEGTMFETKAVKLTWENSVDVDPGDKVVYTVVIASDAQFTTGLGTFRDIKRPEFSVPYDKIGEGGKFFWKVSAADKFGLVTYGSGSDSKPWSFSVKKVEPPAPPSQP